MFKKIFFIAFLCFSPTVLASTVEEEGTFCPEQRDRMAGYREDFDHENLDTWITKLNKGIKVNKISSIDKKWVSLIFKSINDIKFFFDFPKISNLTVRIDISYRNLNLKELKQAVILVQTNPAIVDFKIGSFPFSNSLKIQEKESAQKRLLNSYTHYNTLVRKPTDFSYDFGKNDPNEYNIILKGLKNAPSLRKIDLKFLWRESISALEIIESLKDLQFIEEFSLLYGTRGITFKEMMELSNLISVANSLQYLKLESPISEHIFDNISVALNKDAISLKKLELTSRETIPISKETLKAFFQSIGMNQSLETLILKWNFSVSGGIRYLSESLKSNNTLKILILDGCHIGDHGLSYLSEGLEENKLITKLGLSDNGITDEGANAILRALDKNSTLHYISLGSDYRSLVGTGSSSSSSDYLNSIDFFNRISSIKRKEIQQILRERQEFDLSAEHCVTLTESMIPVSDIDPHTELALETSEDISASSSSSSAIPESYVTPYDIP